MIKYLRHLRTNQTLHYGLRYQSIFKFSSLPNVEDPINKRKESNDLTLEYATILKYVQPEMAQRIQQLLDHENYLSSLSHQIAKKQAFAQRKPKPQNQKIDTTLLAELQSQQNSENQTENDNPEPEFEPGLDLQKLSSIKNQKSTFYGPSPLDSFEDFDIDKNLIKALNEMGIMMPSHIQQLAIPQILTGSHCVIGAETGTGKTMTYTLPILHKLLKDVIVTNPQYSPLSKFDKDVSKKNDRSQLHKYHPFEFDAEKKFPFCLIIQPNEALCIQTQKVINELLRLYYGIIYPQHRNEESFYQLKTMALHGRALLPKSNELMPDILVTTTTALLTNLHKKHNENRYRAFLSKIKYIVMDEADCLTRGGARSHIRYLFYNLTHLRKQIETNPLKYKLLLPSALRQSSDSLLYKELNKMGKPQLIFVGATIPTEGGRNVAETIRDWLDKAVWIKTPGLHDVCSHIAQEFRFVPRTMEMDILHQILIGLARDHFTSQLLETDDDILFDEFDQKMKEKEKRKTRAKKRKAMFLDVSDLRKKEMHILIFMNSKKETRECYKQLLRNGWLNTRCIHSQLHREERKERLNHFEQGLVVEHEKQSENSIKQKIQIHKAVNAEMDSSEYKEVINNVHILVSSDFAMRGIDFKHVDIVINAQFPKHATDYLHRAGRTGRGQSSGRVISFFNEHDLDLAWHIQMSLINQYKRILADDEDENDKNMNERGEDVSRVGTTKVRLDDVFGINEGKMSKALRNQKQAIDGMESGYRRMSLPRDYEQMIDLTKMDIDEMDENLVEHMMKYLNKEKKLELKDVKELKKMLQEKRDKKQKLRIPWAYNLEG